MPVHHKRLLLSAGVLHYCAGRVALLHLLNSADKLTLLPKGDKLLLLSSFDLLTAMKKQCYIYLPTFPPTTQASYS